MSGRSTWYRRWIAEPLAALAEQALNMCQVWFPYPLRRYGRKWIVNADDAAAGRFVKSIAFQRLRALEEGRPPIRLVALRGEFRRIAHRGRIAGLFPCIDSQNPDAVRLGLWLMGRSHNKRAIPVAAEFREAFDIRVRREAARSLRRLEAWAELRGMALGDADPRVRRLATARPAAPFDQRLRRTAGSTLTAVAPQERRGRSSLFVREPMGPGNPPKSAEWIRIILERIRRLVRGI